MVLKKDFEVLFTKVTLWDETSSSTAVEPTPSSREFCVPIFQLETKAILPQAFEVNYKYLKGIKTKRPNSLLKQIISPHTLKSSSKLIPKLKKLKNKGKTVKVVVP